MENASMNKKITGLLVALAVVGSAVASDSNNKTHLNTRVCRENIPAYTTFGEMIANKDEDRWGSNFALTGFFGRSTNGSHLARNFGTDGAETILVQVTNDNEAATTHEFRNLNTVANRTNVPGELLLHMQGVATNPLSGTLRFEPRQIVYGAVLDYYQNFDRWFEGLFFSLRIPLVRIENDIHLSIENGFVGGRTNENIPLVDMFNGAYHNRTTDSDQNFALKYGKMCCNTKSGLGDIEANFGYRFLDGSKYHSAFNISVVFPVAGDADPAFLWGARTGENKWGLGFGFDGSATLWEEADQNLKLVGCAQYKYLFSGTERRTLGLKELRYFNYASVVDTVHDPILSPYYLVGLQGIKGLQPLANISTLDVKVEPGSQIDATVAYVYNNGGFTLDMGYNLFWKEAERVSLKTTCTGWDNAKYGVSNKTYNADTTLFGKTNTLAGATATDAQAYIQTSDLDTRKAETPAQIVHKVFAGVGYLTRNWEYPIMVGAGVSYEIPSSNRDAAEGYAFWAKAGISF